MSTENSKGRGVQADVDDLSPRGRLRFVKDLRRLISDEEIWVQASRLDIGSDDETAEGDVKDGEIILRVLRAWVEELER